MFYEILLALSFFSLLYVNLTISSQEGRPEINDYNGCDDLTRHHNNHTTFVTRLAKQHPVYMVRLNLSQLSLSELHNHSNGCKAQHYIFTL